MLEELTGLRLEVDRLRLVEQRFNRSAGAMEVSDDPGARAPVDWLQLERMSQMIYRLTDELKAKECVGGAPCC